MPPILQLTTYRCAKCGWSDFHHATRCPKCGGEVTTATVAGEGAIATFTTIRYPPKGFETGAPYIVALISLKNGLRIIGRVRSSPKEVTIGGKVSLVDDKGGVLEFEVSA